MKSKKSADRSHWVSGENFQFTPKPSLIKESRRKTTHGRVTSWVHSKQLRSERKFKSHTPHFSKKPMKVHFTLEPRNVRYLRSREQKQKTSIKGNKDNADEQITENKANVKAGRKGSSVIAEVTKSNRAKKSKKGKSQSSKIVKSPQSSKMAKSPQSSEIGKSPQSSKKAKSPQISKTESPQNSIKTKSPQSRKKSKSPQISKKTKSPQSSKNEKSPQSSTNEKSPQISKKTKSPQSSKKKKSPQISKKPKSRQSIKKTKSPQSIKKAKSPQSSKKPKSPQSIKKAKSPQSSKKTKSPQSSKKAKSSMRRRKILAGVKPHTPKATMSKMTSSLTKQGKSPRNNDLHSSPSKRKSITSKGTKMASPEVTPKKRPSSPSRMKIPSPIKKIKLSPENDVTEEYFPVFQKDASSSTTVKDKQQKDSFSYKKELEEISKDNEEQASIDDIEEMFLNGTDEAFTSSKITDAKMDCGQTENDGPGNEIDGAAQQTSSSWSCNIF